MPTVTGGDVLLTTAELAVGLGGFGSVVAAFIGNRRRWEPMEVVRFRALIVISLLSALVALLPFAFSAAGIGEPALWVISSALAALLAVLALSWMLVFARRPMAQHGSPVWSAVAIILAAAMILVNLLNTAGVGFQQTFTGYYVGLLLQLALAGIYFTRLIILSGPRIEEP